MSESQIRINIVDSMIRQYRGLRNKHEISNLEYNNLCTTALGFLSNNELDKLAKRL